MKIDDCIQCGCKLREIDKFCSECGEITMAGVAVRSLRQIRLENLREVCSGDRSSCGVPNCVECRNYLTDEKGSGVE